MSDERVDIFKLGVPNAKPEPRFADIAAAPGADAWQPGKKLYLSKFKPVPNSPELERVLALPRRPQLDLQSTRATVLAEMMTARWSRGERACRCAEIDPKIAAGKRKCIKMLKPVQAWALYEMGIVGGLLGSLVVGSGKTLLNILAPLALAPLGVKRSILLVPPNLLDQLERDYLLIREHFKVPSAFIHGLEQRYEVPDCDSYLHVIPYSRLSMHTASAWIRELDPDAIIADECFPGHTLIRTNEGDLPISEVVDNGRASHVLGFEIRTKQCVWRRILDRARRSRTKPMVRVSHTHGIFECTNDHKIWTNRGYVKARALTSEDVLVSVSAQQVQNAKIIEVLEREAVDGDHVYDLTVEIDHNYFADGVLVSNCDRLRDPNGAASSRVMRYFTEHEETKFCGWTGSLTDSSVTDYAHLAVLALRMQSPLPIDPGVVTDWARALDESDNPGPPGQLGRMCVTFDGQPDERLDPDNTDDVREGFRRRLAETMGVVVSTEASVDVDLVIEERQAPEIPAIVEEALHKVRSCWVRPDTLVGAEFDEELVDAMQVAKCARELASGIFYRWRFDPIHGVPQRKTDIDEWYDARKDWNRELRGRLSDRVEWLDSQMLCEHAAQRYWGDRAPRDDRPSWGSIHWPRWRDIKSKVKPTVEACRVSDYLVVDAARWALEHRGIVWYGMVEFGRWVAELSGLPLHEGGPMAGQKIAREAGETSIVASIKSHGRGRDGLQALFTEQLIAQPPSSATIFEQMLGRLHRQGQDKPVHACYYSHTDELREALETALARAGYVRGTLGSEQKLLIGRR